MHAHAHIVAIYMYPHSHAHAPHAPHMCMCEDVRAVCMRVDGGVEIVSPVSHACIAWPCSTSGSWMLTRAAKEPVWSSDLLGEIEGRPSDSSCSLDSMGCQHQTTTCPPSAHPNLTHQAVTHQTANVELHLPSPARRTERTAEGGGRSTFSSSGPRVESKHPSTTPSTRNRHPSTRRRRAGAWNLPQRARST